MRARAPVGCTNGITGIALTKLDVLDGLDELKICVGYTLDGVEIDHLPASQAQQAQVEAASTSRSKAGKNRLPAPAAGRSSGPGDQICPSGRRADRCAGRAAFHQPGA
jgi:hypothetical protein